jgi:GNAT superfamily N-acetyltransferase
VTEPRRPTVRRADQDDEAAVFELSADMAITFTVERAAFGRSFKTLIAAADARLLVIDLDGQVEGYLLGFTHPSFYANGPVAWVEEIAIRDRLRRRHLGSLLMGAFEKEARGAGARLVALATTRAGAFYEAVGYEPSATYFRKTF